MFSALSARLTAVASRARALSIGSSSPVSSAKSKNARARQIVVLRIVDKTSSQPLSRFQVLIEIGTEFGDELRAQHSQLAVRRVIAPHQTGRATCRERMCQYGWITVGPGEKKK